MGPKDALALLKGIDTVIAAKGKRIVRFDLKKDKPAHADLLKAIIGPSGNLRAPTWRRGKTLVVGFHEDAYKDVLGT
ncbi:MAG: hypothetical protein L6R28_01500 [Planctomycetes bacterium]|nr:hypothetical protein [Planctomycetota bacterium]